jgi:hypothetical protein
MITTIIVQGLGGPCLVMPILINICPVYVILMESPFPSWNFLSQLLIYIFRRSCQKYTKRGLRRLEYSAYIW